MEKQNKVLWYGHFEDEKQALLLDAKEIETVALISEDETFVINNVELKDEELTERLKEYIETSEVRNEDFNPGALDDIEIFLHSIGCKGAAAEYCDKYSEKKDQLIYDVTNQVFANLMDFEDLKIYRYHDGSNWQTIEFLDHMSETKIEVTEDYVDLDEWDGRNHVTGGIGNHERIHKVITLDGKPSLNTFLVHCWSQWQGSHVTGELLSSPEAVEEYIENLGDRNINEYMFEVGELAGKSFLLS